MVTCETPKTLRDLREEKGTRENRKISHQELVEAIARIRKEEPRHWTASVQWERRGIRNDEIVEALEIYYGLPSVDIRKASRNSRLYGIPEEDRRRRKYDK